MNTNHRARSILCLVLVAFYAVGMACMLLNAFSIGLIFWVVSTIGGLAMLYHIKDKERRVAEAERLKKESESGDDEECE